MKRITALLFGWTLAEATAFASQAEFDHVCRLWYISTTQFNDTLHVDAFGSDKTSSNLEIFVVFNLNIESTCILGSGA